MSVGGKVAIGVAALVVAGLTALVLWGLGLYEDEVCDHLRAQAAVVEELGPLTACKQQTMSSGRIGDTDTFVFALTGPKGGGKAYVKSSSTGKDGAEVYQGVLLVVGTREILVEGARPPTE